MRLFGNHDRIGDCNEHQVVTRLLIDLSFADCCYRHTDQRRGLAARQHPGRIENVFRRKRVRPRYRQ